MIMNAEAEFVAGGGSDSDLTSDDDAPDYYVPISFLDEGDVSDPDPDSESQVNGDFSHLPNGYAYEENGISSLRLSCEGLESDDGNDEEEGADTAEDRESSRAIERAFIEDERRRNAPLTAENAGRVIEAMREVSFGGSPPDWVDRVPEDEWIDRLRRLSRPPSASA